MHYTDMVSTTSIIYHIYYSPQNACIILVVSRFSCCLLCASNDLQYWFFIGNCAIYLMILLTNCSWEIPFPHVVKAIYSKFNREGTDPRFVKLKPIFRSTMLKSANIQRYSAFTFYMMTTLQVQHNSVL